MSAQPIAHPPAPTVVTISLGQSAQDMRKVSLAALEGPPRDVVIDLRAALSVTPTALALLIRLRARQRSRQRTLTLVCARDSAAEQALAGAGMRQLFTTVTAPPATRGTGQHSAGPV
jgi:hypothetical protein